jgi:hypothetical protein
MRSSILMRAKSKMGCSSQVHQLLVRNAGFFGHPAHYFQGERVFGTAPLIFGRGVVALRSRLRRRAAALAADTRLAA